MALYFFLSAELGLDEGRAKAFEAHFGGERLRCEGIAEVACRVFSNRPGGIFWVSVWPEGASMGSPFGDNPALTKKEATSALGQALYERLRSAPPFRFAIAGWEAEEVRSYEDLANNFAEELVAGLVVEQALVPREPPLALQPFAPGYSWLPYQGETWG